LCIGGKEIFRTLEDSWILDFFFFFSSVEIQPSTVHMMNKFLATRPHARSLDIDFQLILFAGDSKILYGPESEEGLMEV
jgi:hypothetical protein